MSHTFHVKVLIQVVFVLLAFVSFLFINTKDVFASATSTPRLEQLVKDTQNTLYTGQRQHLSCDDLSGHIESVTISMANIYPNTDGQYRMSVLGGVGPTRISENIVVLDGDDYSVQRDVTFTFNPAIDVDTDLCANGGTVRFELVNLSLSGAIVFGSAADTYPGGFFSKGSITPKIADMYFIINGNAEVNHLPVLNEVGDKAATEGSLLTFSLSATDQDQFAKPTYSVTGLPEHAVFIGDTFYWVPGFDQAGSYSIELKATDAGNAGMPSEFDTETISIIVSEATPELNNLSQLVKDTQSLLYTNLRQSLSCDDLSGHIESLTISMANNSTVTDGRYQMQVSGGIGPIYVSENIVVLDTDEYNVQQDVTFTFNPAIDVDTDLCAGAGTVRFGLVTLDTSGAIVFGSAADTYLGGIVSQSVQTRKIADMYFIINGNAEVNHSPVLDEVGDKATTEGSLLTLKLSATDQDQYAKPTYGVTGLPEHAVFIDDTFYWVPGFDQAGSYSIELKATDAGNAGIPPESDTETISITVSEATPELNSLSQLVKDTKTILYPGQRQSLSCDDLSGHIESLTVSMVNISPNTDGQYQMNVLGGISPTYISENIAVLDADDYNVQQDVTFTFNPAIDVDTDLCANGGTVRFSLVNLSTASASVFGSAADTYPGGIVSQSVYPLPKIADMYFIINGNAVSNSAPTLTTIGNQIGTEGETLQFTVVGNDIDGDALTYSASGTPTGATFDANTGLFSWTPGYSDAGIYDVTFTVTEDTPEMLSASETVSIEVLNTNRAPVLEPIGNQSTAENQNLSFTVSATDPDGDSLTYSAANLPSGATFDAQTQTFNWTPGYSDAGNYSDIEFTVIDSGSPMELDIELITITVGNVNRAPVIDNPGPQEVLETETLSFSVSAVDPDGDAVTYSASNTPAGSTFSPATGVFSWTPSLSDEGVYMVTFIASDDGSPQESAELTVVITVGDNPTPTEQAEDLVEDIVVFAFPANVENSYLANLHKVEQFILDGKINAALNQLDAFVNKLNQDYNQGVVTQQEYDSLLGAANNLIADLQN